MKLRINHLTWTITGTDRSDQNLLGNDSDIRSESPTSIVPVPISAQIFRKNSSAEPCAMS